MSPLGARANAGLCVQRGGGCLADPFRPESNSRKGEGRAVAREGQGRIAPLGKGRRYREVRGLSRARSLVKGAARAIIAGAATSLGEFSYAREGALEASVCCRDFQRKGMRSAMARAGCVETRSTTSRR